ncbi:hypothetical protein LPJ70_006352 [Coemansia sp. RSA 2708]|nr:hypothetical protein LPJ70_006352 [Coemansia sp. RSA 2708]
MDGFGHQLAADAAEAEGCAPTRSASSTPPDDRLDTAFTSMFGFAAQWGKKLQSELQLDQFVDQLKKQSSEATKAYSQDLAEFAQVVKSGATRGIDELSSRLTQLNSDHTLLEQQQARAKRLLGRLGSDLEDLLRDAIVIESPGSNSTQEQREHARKVIYDRRMAQLAQIREAESTYVEALGPDADRFVKEWDSEAHKEEIAGLLNDEAVRGMFERLVPGTVAEDVFWQRYFFHAWMVEQEEARRKQLVEAAVQATAEEEFSWDMDDDDEESPKASKDQAKESERSDQKSDSNADQKSDHKLETEPAASVQPETKGEAKPETKPEDKPEAKSEIKSEDKSEKTAEGDDWDEWE